MRFLSGACASHPTLHALSNGVLISEFYRADLEIIKPQVLGRGGIFECFNDFCLKNQGKYSLLKYIYFSISNTMESATTSKAMTTIEFSKHILCVSDLYDAAVRNGFYLPMKSSSAVNEVMLVNVLKGTYWCPKTNEIRIKNCV